MNIAFKDKEKGLQVAQCRFPGASPQLVGTNVAKEAGSAAKREGKWIRMLLWGVKAGGRAARHFLADSSN